jgi:DNA-directed RNA polymerase subunit M/transcription elongation factor TFIIS
MKFCPECNFLLYYHEKDKQLHQNCKNCGYDEKSDEVIISTTVYKKDIIEDITFNKYNVYDNALLHTIHYTCPNKKCETFENKELKDAIIYNEDDLQIVYICTVCKTEWN